MTVQRFKTILALAIPIVVAQSSTLVMSLIDLAMVGTLGFATIGAVGLSVFSYSLVVIILAGVENAVQGLAARRIGEGSHQVQCAPLNCGLFISVVVGLPLTIVCSLLSPYVFSLLSSDPEVVKVGGAYLSTMYLGIVGVGVNNAFKGHWAAMGKTKTYMAAALFMDGLHVVLNYMLIFGHFGAPAMGATGAAISSVCAQYAGVLLNLVFAFAYLRKDGFLASLPEKALLFRIVKMALPASLEGFFFSASHLVYLWMVGLVGTAELAAANVLVRTSLVLMIVATGVGVAAATLVSKTAGEGDMSLAAQWGWDSAKLGVIAISLLGLPLVFFPRVFLSLFLVDSHTMSIALVPMQLVGATAGIASIIWIFTYTLFALGDGNRVAAVALFMQWLFFLPLVWLVGPHFHYGLLQIWLVNTLNGALVAAMITAIWADGKWKTIRV